MMASDASDANKMADAGLSAVSNTMEFLRDGKTCPLVEAMDSKAAYGTFSTKVVKGQGQRKDGLVLRAGNGGSFIFSFSFSFSIFFIHNELSSI